MSNYLIDLMTWSYSRLKCYLQCPYQFYLKYIESLDEAPMFFAEYGSLIHDILARFYRGQITSDSAQNEFMIRFATEIGGRAPSQDIRNSFFLSGIEAMRSPSPISGRILDVEQRVQFRVSGKPFIGYIDMVYEDSDGALVVLDHKSRNLKPRSSRQKPTATDVELDDYLRQLYLYSIPVLYKYERWPDFLEFNCYRSGVRIREKFSRYAFDNAKGWAGQTMDAIAAETKWHPKPEYWKCRQMCPFCGQCEYVEMGMI